MKRMTSVKNNSHCTGLCIVVASGANFGVLSQLREPMAPGPRDSEGARLQRASKGFVLEGYRVCCFARTLSGHKRGSCLDLFGQSKSVLIQPIFTTQSPFLLNPEAYLPLGSRLWLVEMSLLFQYSSVISV